MTEILSLRPRMTWGVAQDDEGRWWSAPYVPAGGPGLRRDDGRGLVAPRAWRGSWAYGPGWQRGGGWVPGDPPGIPACAGMTRREDDGKGRTPNLAEIAPFGRLRTRDGPDDAGVDV